MSSNRLIYDRCAYATEIKESTEPLEYNLFLGKFENCKQCPVGNFPNILPFGPRTETESELWGLPRHNSKCPEKKFVANSEYNNPPLSAARMCESIYYITPNNLVKPTSNMLNEKNLGVNFCPAKKTVEKFDNMNNSDVSYLNNHNIMNCNTIENEYPSIQMNIRKCASDHDAEVSQYEKCTKDVINKNPLPQSCMKGISNTDISCNLVYKQQTDGINKCYQDNLVSIKKADSQMNLCNHIIKTSDGYIKMQKKKEECKNNNQQIESYVIKQCKENLWNKYPEIYSCYNNSKKFTECGNMLAKEYDCMNYDYECNGKLRKNIESLCTKHQTNFEKCYKNLDKNKKTEMTNKLDSCNNLFK